MQLRQRREREMVLPSAAMGGGMLRFYYSPFGRISRKSFWLKYVPVLIVLFIGSDIADQYLYPGVILVGGYGPASTAVNVLTLWPQIAVTTKRFHDRGMSGWWQFLFNIGIVLGAVFLLSAMLEAEAAGEIEPNLWTPLLVGAGLLVVFGLGELIILGFLRGTKGRNKYGDDPLGAVRTASEAAPAT